MTPNYEQILAIIRWLLSTGGPAGALLIARKIPPEQVTALQTAVLTILGAAPPIISFALSMWKHTDKSAVQVASNIVAPDGEKTIVVTSPELAAATPGQNNIVSHADVKVTTK